MTYLKIPHQSAKDILSCYEASDEILELVEQYIEPAALIDAAIKAEFFLAILPSLSPMPCP